MSISKYFVTLLILTMVCSCEPGPEEVVDLPARHIAKIETFDKDTSGNLYVSSRTTFENNKPVIKEVFGGSVNTPWLKCMYSYNEQGLLYSNAGTTMVDGSTQTFSATYDTQGRITSSTYSYHSGAETVQSTRTFTYQDNTIIGHYPDGGTMTYLLDDGGKIMQLIVDGDVSRELTYEGNNIVAFRDGPNLSTFEYGNDIVNGASVSYLDDMVGGKNNRILLYDLNDYPWAHDRYLIQAQYSGALFPWIYTYEMDDDNYPVNILTQFANEITSTKIFYE